MAYGVAAHPPLIGLNQSHPPTALSSHGVPAQFSFFPEKIPVADKGELCNTQNESKPANPCLSQLYLQPNRHYCGKNSNLSQKKKKEKEKERKNGSYMKKQLGNLFSRENILDVTNRKLRGEIEETQKEKLSFVIAQY